MKKLHRRLHRLPKVDLHRHLIGSIRLGTLIDIAIKNNISLPAYTPKGLASLIISRASAPNLREFVKPLEIFGRCYCHKKAISKIAYEAVEDAYHDNVRYLEMAVGTAFEASFHKLSLNEVFAGIINGIKLAEEKYDIKVNLLAGPSFRWKERGWHSPEEVLQVALKYKEKVKGFGLTAESREGIPFSKWKSDLRREYIRIAKQAKDAGLKITVHAGEVSRAIAIRDSLKFLNADRIGHGLSIIKDQKILELIVRRNIPLEICLTSNVKSGAVSQIGKHPFKELFRRGVKVTLNTDDPTLCQTTLTNEYVIAVKKLGLNLSDIKKIILNSVSSAFLAEREKKKLLRYFIDSLNVEMENNKGEIV